MQSQSLTSALWEAANTLRNSAVDRTDWKGELVVNQRGESWVGVSSGPKVGSDPSRLSPDRAMLHNAC